MVIDRKSLEIILEALDTLALALTEDAHKWKASERRIYKKAVKIIGRREGND